MREHNGDVVGGAKATRDGRPWIPVALVSGFPSWQETLLFESQFRNGKSNRFRKTSRLRKRAARPNIVTRLNFLIKRVQTDSSLTVEVNSGILEMDEFQICKTQLIQLNHLSKQSEMDAKKMEDVVNIS